MCHFWWTAPIPLRAQTGPVLACPQVFASQSLTHYQWRFRWVAPNYNSLCAFAEHWEIMTCVWLRNSFPIIVLKYALSRCVLGFHLSWLVELVWFGQYTLGLVTVSSFPDGLFKIWHHANTTTTTLTHRNTSFYFYYIAHGFLDWLQVWRLLILRDVGWASCPSCSDLQEKQTEREHCCWQKHAATLTTLIHEMLWFGSDTAGRPSGEGSRKTQAKAIESAKLTERMHNRTCRTAQNVKTWRQSVSDVRCLSLLLCSEDFELFLPCYFKPEMCCHTTDNPCIFNTKKNKWRRPAMVPKITLVVNLWQGSVQN